jgi:hypothetical protein
MFDPNMLDRELLLMHLKNFEIIIHINPHLQNLFAKEELDKKLELALTYVNQTYEWEKEGDRAKYDDALRNANRIIVEVGSVITRVLAGNTPPDDLDPPSPEKVD